MYAGARLVRLRTTVGRLVLCLGVAGSLLVRPEDASYAGGQALSAPVQRPSANPSLSGFTAAYRRATLATLQQGRVSRLAVKEGQHVEQGEVIATLDSNVQAARTEIARLDAQSTTKVELARVQIEHARGELNRLNRLTQATAASESEVRQAQLSYDTAVLALQQAQQEHTQAIENHRLQQELLGQYELRAPFSGYITSRLKEVGETVEELEGVMELCQLDTLLVTIDCPLARYKSIRVGDRLRLVPIDAKWDARIGEVTSCIPVGDPSSQTFKLKLTVPNEDGSWIAGLLVSVDQDGPLPGASTSPAASQPATAPAAP